MLNWTKICRTCKEIKVAPEYYKDQGKSDGLATQCIKCNDQHYDNHDMDLDRIIKDNKDLLDKLK